MEQDKELSEIMQSIAEKGLRLMASYKQQPGQLPMLLEKGGEIFKDFQNLFIALFKNPDKIVKAQFAYWQDAMGLLEEQFRHWLLGKSMPINDRRFNSEEWVQNPFFNLLTQQYLLASEHMQSLLEQLDYGEAHVARRVRFLARQYLDALSPDNFLHTNPQLIAETIQTHGKNLLRGLNNFLGDIEAGSARLIMKMTDPDAFKVGSNLAVTPGKVIFKNELMELIQYAPMTETVKAVPLLIIPPWINKYYILDLSPHNSFVRWLTTQGITVFMISWVNPDASYAGKGIEDYLNEGPIAAIDIIKKQLQIEQVNTLGFCIGGTLLALLLAYFKTQDNHSIRSATFLATLLDFSDPGDISVFIDEEQIARLEEKMNLDGYLDGHFMASAFNSLRASDLIWSFFIRNYLSGKPPVPFDILYWNADSTNMPAKMHSQYLRWMYLHNDLIKSNKIVINNTPIDISRIEVPAFFVATIKDHIAPWETVFKGFQYYGGDKEFLLGGSGHIAGIVIPPGGEKYGYYVNREPRANAAEWLKTAKHSTGSWWPYWVKWLKNHSGGFRSATSFKQLPYQPIADAPGDYVFLNTKAQAAKKGKNMASKKEEGACLPQAAVADAAVEIS
ncbi:PHA/PHB synthase family protein [Legionella londiniensis]|uniref:Poly-beta-hydroxybutyrate polymerase n=1 Tax=Legionella londiniensis TaxID=45068 RepID=A0A0W0VHM7_9GAMM|nr:class I poly(R)-hydroxyalkanoic acid synthase [Legionella londiniensis]KTD19648.1 poly-beta-hydroxybutyrate polymerase [Legionella londiniensis]STX92442.1 poly-beta-hydroxybutyrate polymerase [Legionella londiniensis]